VFTIQELYEYASQVRNRFARKFAELPWEEVDKNREATFFSMKNILLHMIDNEDWIVNFAIRERSNEYVRRKSAEYTNLQIILDHLFDVEKKTRSFLTKTGEDELHRNVKFVLSSGQSFEMSVEECLFQSFTEQLYHIGELIALLWQDNIEPPAMQWFRNNPRHPNEIRA
jgi:uncharacterized damage-inducible protein DinB